MVVDLSQYNLDSLFRELKGKSLMNFVSEFCFNDPADYAAQTPSLYPLGVLHLMGSDGGRGSGERWANEDESIFVDIDRDGVVKWVHQPR